MVHWCIPIITFVVGFGACYSILYGLLKIGARVQRTIDSTADQDLIPR